MASFYIVYRDRPIGDDFAGWSEMLLQRTVVMTKEAALAEAGRLISTGEGFDPALYDARNDAEVMDTRAVRRWLGLDRLP
jgi:hypothetical protein